MRAVRWVPWIMTTGLLGLVFYLTDLRAFWETLNGSKWTWVFFAIMLALFGITGIKTTRMRMILKPLPGGERKSNWLELFSLFSATRFLNLALPMRAGEALRVARLHRRFGIPIKPAIASVGMETALDILALAIVAAILFPFAPMGLVRPLAILILCALAVFGIIWSFDRFIALRSFARSFHTIFHSKAGRTALMLTLVVDFLDVVMIYSCLRAVGIAITWPFAFFVLAAINLAMALPTPGHLGTLEAGALFALEAGGVAHAPALTFALLYHMAHWVPVILWGCWSLPAELNAGTLGINEDFG